MLIYVLCYSFIKREKSEIMNSLFMKTVRFLSLHINTNAKNAAKKSFLRKLHMSVSSLLHIQQKIRKEILIRKNAFICLIHFLYII